MSLSQTKKDLLAKLLAQKGIANKDEYRITKLPSKDEYELSYSQKRLWFIQRLDPDSSAYNVPVRLHISGELQTDLLLEAFHCVIHRHAALRTRFVEIDGEPVQIIEDRIDFDLTIEDWRGQTKERLDAEIRRQAGKGFELEQAGQIRVRVWQTGESEYEMLLVLHHIITDGWSMNVLVKHLAGEYDARRSGKNEPASDAGLLQYTDYADWQKVQDQERQIEYWNDKLSGNLENGEFPADFDRPSRAAHEGERLAITIEKETVGTLKQIGRECGATIFMILAAALKVLLWRYSGGEDVAVGFPNANRRRGQTDEIIGFFVNNLLINEKIGASESFETYLSKIKKTILDAFANQDVPFEKLVEIIQPERRQGVNPLFQIVLNWQENTIESFSVAGLEIKTVEFDSGLTRFDFEFHLTEKTDGEVSGFLIFNSSLYEKETCDRLIENFKNLLVKISEDHKTPVCDIDFLTKSEKKKILGEFAAAPSLYPSEKTIKELFEERAARNPEAACLKFRDETLSYGEVNDRANQVAAFLIENGIETEDFIGLSAERSFELVIGMLGILKAGAAYVPLDESYPVERLREMIEETGIKTILTGNDRFRLSVQNEVRLKTVEEILRTQPPGNDPVIPLAAENLAYVMFTSGSTGKPKGVAVSHRAVVRLAINNNFARLDENEILLMLAPVSFDASTLEIWGSFLNGGQLVIMPPGIPMPETLEKEIEAGDVTTLWLTSGLFNLVMDRRPSALRNVKQLLAGGDVLSSENVHEFLKTFPDAAIINGYGPTENTTFSCCFPMKANEFYGANIPVGFPVANSEVYILDAKLNTVPLGAIGEIYVGGDGLARGYYGHPRLTAASFVPHPFSEKTGERLYKTGDIGRFRNDGSVEFRGRKDNQVKVRGYRIELAEIETALMRHAAVGDAAVITADDGKRLIAFAVCGDDDNAAPVREMRRFLQKRLPEFMIPSEIFYVPRIPLTANGKVDRATLHSLRRTGEPETLNPPTDPLEMEIGNVWSEILGGRRVGADENFFEVGGHSLAAVKVVSKINSHFDVEIPLDAFFENPTVSALADLVRKNSVFENGAKKNHSIERLNRNSYRMSYSQKRLWFIEQLQPDSSAYNVPVRLHISGDLRRDALRAAFHSLIRRHAALRTRFVEIDGEPVQIIEDRIDFDFIFNGERKISAEELNKEIEREAGKGFELERAGQIRARVWQTGESEYEMLLVLHHIITDGWSMNVLVKHLAADYERFAVGALFDETEARTAESGKLKYGDYAEYQIEQFEDGKLTERIDYWKTELMNSGRSEIPVDYVRKPEATFDGGQIHFAVDDETAAKLNEIAREQKATLFMVLAAALKILLWRYSGEKDVVIGFPAANRDAEETSELVGFFVNTLVLRNRIEPEKPFSELLENVRKKSLKAFADQSVPFEKLVEIIQPDRDWNAAPLFQVMLILQNFPVEKITLSELEITPVEAYSGKAKLDLVFNLREENGRILGNIEYRREIYKKQTVERLASQFTELLRNISVSPERKVSEIPLMTGEDKARLLMETALNDEFGGEATIHGLFEKAVQHFPSEICVESGERVCDYQTLNKRANRIANAVTGQTSGKNPVGVMVSDNLEQIAAMLGILKSGNHFFCLDPEHPSERLEQILDETRPVCLIADSKSIEKQIGLFEKDKDLSRKTIVLDDESGKYVGEGDIESLPETAPPSVVAPDDTAYIVYTSGSTGRPKGIVQTHRAFSQFVRWFGNEFGLSPKVRMAQWASVTYDAAYAEIFSALASGATLCLMNSKTKNDPHSAAEWIYENSVTIFQTVPGFFSGMFSESGAEKFSKLEYLLLAGEILPVGAVEKWLAEFPASPVLYNLYGPTESVLATFHRIRKIERGAKSVSIGRAIDGRQILILDEQKRVCPYGVPGEVYIRSRYLTAGYFKRDEETSKRFIVNPLSSDDEKDKVFRTGDLARRIDKDNIEFFGRIDSQVKIRGNRIEIEEIEGAFKEIPAIRDCAVVAAPNAFGQLALTAFAVSEEEIPASVIRKNLAEKLPAYMLPSMILFAEKVPRAASGKPDRRLLTALIPETSEQMRQEYAAPETAIEKELAEIWAKLLGVENVGATDDFFQLGGHSLLAAQIVNTVRRDYATEISLRSFVTNPTIRQLAEHIELSKKFFGIDQHRLAELIEQVKKLTDGQVAEMTEALLAAKKR